MPSASPSKRRALRPVIGALAVAAAFMASVAFAADRSQDYRFDIVDQPVPVGAHTEITVKLSRVPEGQPVADAKIIRSRLEMTMMHPPHKGSPPGGMTTEMGGEVRFLDSPAPGLYRLMADVSMPGKWTLDLSATVPDEPEPVSGTVKFDAGR
jgi:hypothetical protein